MLSNRSQKSIDLRSRAEDILRGKNEYLKELSAQDIQSLIHELQVHQIELEMQNEELRKAQNELGEARDKYADLYDFAPVGYFTFDRSGLILEVNLTGAHRLGMERSVLVKKPFYFYIAPDSKDEFFTHLKQVFGTSARQTCELEIVDKSGNQFYARLESLAVQDSEGKPGLCRTAVSDITERKRVEEALRKAHDELEIRVEKRTAELAHANEELNAEAAERKRAEEATKQSEERFKSIFSQSPIGIGVYNAEGVLVELNDAAMTMFGIDRLDQIRGLKLFSSPTVSEEERMNLKNLERVQEEVVYDFDKIRQVGFYETSKTGIFYFNRIITPLRSSSSSEPYGYLVQVQDITERKRIEEALLRAHEELEKRVKERTKELEEANRTLQAEIAERARVEEKIWEQAAILNNAHDAIIVRDMEDRIVYWNKGAAYLYGWTAEEVTGKNAVELLYKEISPALTEAQKSVLERDEWSGELHHMTKDGKELTVESHWTLMRGRKDRPKSILIINTDITGRKMLEAQFLRAQRMESIGRLAGGIAHDLNNMMTPIMLSLQMLREKLTDEKSHRLIDILERNAQRSADLIKQVLSFSRGVEGEYKTLQAGDLILEIERIAKETFPRSIEIRTDIPRDLWGMSGDATQLHQVLMNLCVNARDAMPDGGILSISAGNTHVDEKFSHANIDARVGPYTVITVSDTGTGIPPGILDKIFEPFFTTKELGKGTGLGLSTSLAIVKSHGGFIDVHSKVGAGTTFRIYLPAIKARTQEEEPEPRMPSEEHSGRGETILVIDERSPDP